MQLPKMHPQVIENAWGQGEEGIVKSVSGPRDVTHEAFGALRLVRKLGLSSICPNGVGFHFLTDGYGF
jgi:hypothetical protein